MKLSGFCDLSVFRGYKPYVFRTIITKCITKTAFINDGKGTTIPSNPIEDHGIDLNKPIVYALPYRSSVDLLTLQAQVIQLGLPDLFTPIEINGKSFRRYVFISFVKL